MALPQQRQCCGTSVSAQNRDTGPDRDWPSPHLYRTERKKNPKPNQPNRKTGPTGAPAHPPTCPSGPETPLSSLLTRGGEPGGFRIQKENARPSQLEHSLERVKKTRNPPFAADSAAANARLPANSEQKMSQPGQETKPNQKKRKPSADVAAQRFPQREFCVRNRTPTTKFRRS